MPATSKPSSGNKRGQKTRKAIIRAAEKAIFRHGVKGATLENIAHEAGIHEQTLYRHYPNKTALLSAITEDEIRIVRDGLKNPDRKKNILDWWYDLKSKITSDAHIDGIRNFIALMMELESSGHHATGHYSIENILAEAFAEEMGVAAESNEPQLIATLLYWSTMRFFREASEEADITEKELLEKFRQLISDIEDIYGRLLVKTRRN